jgi:hypothetical protein
MDQVTLPRATVQQALEALEKSETWVPDEGFGMRRFLRKRKHEAAITALKAALEQPVQEPAKRATGWVAPKDHYTTPVFFNPYTGDPRDVRDVRSDPQGILIVPPGAAWLTAKG